MAKQNKKPNTFARRAPSLHGCKMLFGYNAPHSFAKLLYEGVVFGSSREKSIKCFFRLLRGTVVSCGRCGASIQEAIWTRDDVASLFDLARAKGLDHLREVMCREYDARVLTCGACDHAAHLAWDEPTADDPRVPF